MEDPSLIQSARRTLEESPGEVVAVYLYGSRARGTGQAASDVDLGVLLRQTPRPALRGVTRQLESVLERVLRVPVEAVLLNTASADLIHRVLRDGILLLDRDRQTRIRFEVQARNEYFDLAPVRRLYRRVPA